MNKENQPLITMVSVQKNFDGLKILNSINLTINRGEILVIVGPSGSGKSTLLRSLIKLIDIDDGEIWVDNNCLVKNVNGKVKYASLNILRNIRLKFGLIFQNFQLFPHLTVLENMITAPICVTKVTQKLAIREAKELLKKVALDNYCNAYPCALSGGQKQRAAIVRALAMKPEIVLFDEPTSALDPELAIGVLKVIKDLVFQYRKTMIIVTHQLHFIKTVADRMIFMDSGRIIEQGKPHELFSNPQTRRLKVFLSHKEEFVTVN
jgi:polar amino acid transport system ATP-binding protein